MWTWFSQNVLGSIVANILLALPVGVFRHYVGVLGAGSEPNGSPGRARYDGLRNSLGKGGTPAGIYAEWLTKTLDAVDRVFGDAGKANQSLFPHAFGLKTPAPLWTAPAFDRCLFLALGYPLISVFVIWVWFGQVGDAEAAVGLPTGTPTWERFLFAAMVILQTVSFYFVRRRTGWESFKWLIPVGLAAFAGAIVMYFSGASPLAISFALSAVVAIVVAALFSAIASETPISSRPWVDFLGVGLFTLSGILAFALIAEFGNLRAGTVAITAAGVGALAFAWPVPGAVAVTVAIVVSSVGSEATTGANTFVFVGGICGIGGAMIVALLEKLAVTRGHAGAFLSIHWWVMIMLCLYAARTLSHLESWSTGGPLLLFLGLLTLLNAPFDWASLGLTRALLRRGLEQDWWGWPYVYALIDAILAVFVIALLACAMVVGVQAFDLLAVRGGGTPVLPLTTLFNELAANPAAPKYWWIYSLLLSTMIPSLVNLTVGGFSLTRGIRVLSQYLYNYMPVGGTNAPSNCTWLAIVLMLQWMIGGILALMAQGFLVWGIIFYVMPRLGYDILYIARLVADLNLAARIF